MYASARRFFARLASEIFLSSLQSGFSSNLLDKDQNYKFETRNPKFETNSKRKYKTNTTFQTTVIRIPRFGIARVLTYWAAVCFGFRYSNFGFCFGLFLGALNLGEVVLLNS